MPARCPSCGEEALTETARFCIGCGGAIPEQEPHVAVTELLAVGSTPPPPERDDTPQLEPRPSLAPSSTGAPVHRQPTRARPPLLAPMLTMRDTSPIVPLPLVVVGIVGLLVLLLILLIAA